jgi:hypothetical protein
MLSTNSTLAAGLLTFARAANFLGVSKRTLEILVADPSAGVPKPFRLGRGKSRRFYLERDLRAFLERKSQEANSPR